FNPGADGRIFAGASDVVSLQPKGGFMAFRSGPGRTTRWTPAAIPVGTMLMLLGAWAFMVPLVGPYFHFGFFTNSTWAFTNEYHLRLCLPAGAAIFAGDLILTMPSR